MLTGRSDCLFGVTYRIETVLGGIYVTINTVDSEGCAPFEVFISGSKTGSEIAAFSEAIGRLCSLVLRLESSMPARDRLTAIADQLHGIGGSGSVGLGTDRVRSVPDGIARVLNEYVADRLSADLTQVVEGKYEGST